jgi:predicted GIY-YIG superfamily endonuclease
VERGHSARQILIDYYTDIAIGVGIGLAAGAMLHFVDDLIYGGGISIGASACFVAGTLVTAERGLVPIEQVQVGDLVWSWQEGTGDLTLQGVINTMGREVKAVVEVVTETELITTTPEHPFWVQGKGWTAAASIVVGDTLPQKGGSVSTVSSVTRRLQDTRVFNLEVARHHTYFVGRSAVVVHNSCPWGQRSGSLPSKPGVYVLRDRESRIYVGRAKDLKSRLTSDSHEQSAIIRDANSEVYTFELDTHQLSGGTADEALRVAEEYLKRAMNANVRGRAHPSFTSSPKGLNESIEISAHSYEAYINRHGFPPLGAPVSH